MKVMLVDDSAPMRLFMREQLQRLGIDVVECRNGREAVDGYPREQPEVVLMDILMPEMDGLEATERILAADAQACIYVLTDYGDDEFRRAARNAGAQRFFHKEEVARLITEIMRRGSRHDAPRE